MTLLCSRDDGDVTSYFEDSSEIWLAGLQTTVVDLGQRLFRDSFTSADAGSRPSARNGGDSIIPTFPLALLVEELEEVAALMVLNADSVGQSGSCYSERAWVAK